MSEVSLPDEHLRKMCSHFNELRNEEKFCDVSVKVGDQSFPCHRLILVSAIEYFRAMFSESFKESKSSEHNLPGVDADDFALLLTYIYGGSVTLRVENIFGLLQISHMMGLQSLEDSCVDFIARSHSIPLDVVVSIFVFACRSNITSLIENFVKFLGQNFVDASNNEEFINVSGNALLQILTCLPADKDVAVKMLDFLGQWVKNHRNEDILPELWREIELKQVPLDLIIKAFMNSAELSDYKDNNKSEENNDLQKGSQEVSTNELDKGMVELYGIKRWREEKLPFLLFAHDSDEENTQRKTVNMYKFVARNNVLHRRLVGTHCFYNLDQSKELYCKSVLVKEHRLTIMCTKSPIQSQLADDSAIEKSNVNTVPDAAPKPVTKLLKTFGASTVQATSVPFSFGQTDSNIAAVAKLSNSFLPCAKYCLQPYICSKSKKLRSLKMFEFSAGVEKLEEIAVAVNDTNIYLYCHAEFIMYNSHRDEWRKMTEVATSNYTRVLSPNLLCHENCLYLVGGTYLTSPNNDNQCLDGKLFQQFDFREGKWSKLPEMTTVRSQSASCIYNDVLYVSGGANLSYFQGGNYVEYFDMKAQKWATFEKVMPEPKINHTVIPYKNQLWFFGGQKYCLSETVPDLSWYSYNLKDNEWSNIHSIPSLYGMKYSTNEILDVIDLKD